MPEPEPDPGRDRRAAQPEVKSRSLGRPDRAAASRATSRQARRTSGRRARSIERPRSPPRAASRSTASAPTTAQGNGSTTCGRPRASGTRCVGRRPVPGGATSTTTRPPGASSWRDPAQQPRPGRRRCRCCRRRAARSASGPRRARARRRRAASPRAAGPGLPDRLGDDVDPERRLAALGQQAGQPAGAAADVQRRSRAQVEQRVVGRVDAAGPAADRQRRGGCTPASGADTRVRRAKATRRTAPLGTSAPSVDRGPPRSREPGVRRVVGDRVGVGGRVDVAQHGSCRRRRAPASCRARRVARPVLGVDIGTSRAGRRAVGSAAPATHQPPSSAGPSTASRPAHASRLATREQLVAVQLRRVHADLDDGDRASRRGRRCAFASRSPKPLAALRHDAPARQRLARSRSPRGRRRGRPTSATGSPSSERLARRRRACPAARPPPGRRPPSRPDGRAPEPGLRRARRRGALATTSDGRRAHAQHPREVARGPQRAPHRAGHLRPGARRARVVGDVVLAEPPAGRGGLAAAARPGSRSAGRATPRASRSLRRHTRIGAMSWTGSPCGAAASHDDARCRRGRATATPRGRAGRRRPTARSARPERDVGEQGHQVARVERAVAVHDRDESRSRPRCRRARPRRTRAGLGDDRRPEPSRDRRRCRRSSRCRPRSPGSRRDPRQQRRQRGCLVTAGEHQVTVGLGHDLHARAAPALQTRREPYEVLTAAFVELAASAPWPPRLAACVATSSTCAPRSSGRERAAAGLAVALALMVTAMVVPAVDRLGRARATRSRRCTPTGSRGSARAPCRPS